MTAACFARTDSTTPDGLRHRQAQWRDGTAQIRAHRAAFAGYWRTENWHALTRTGPLWVVLGDSTAQGLGAPTPDAGYVGQVHAELTHRTGQPWRVLNLSRSGAGALDVLVEQLPRLAGLPVVPALVTCGVGANDILRTSPLRLPAALRALIGALPKGTVVLDLPLPAGFWGVVGRASGPYVSQVNRTIHATARQRGLPVAAVSAHFAPPWASKFGPDRFHPSEFGYRDWTQALLEVICCPG